MEILNQDGDKILTTQNDTELQSNHKVYITTNGCPENRIDAARMINFFKGAGYTVTDNPRNASLVLFNACGLTQSTENYSLKIVKTLKKQMKSSAKIIVFGCLPKINPNCLRNIYEGKTFGSDNIERLSEIINKKIDFSIPPANHLIPVYNNFFINLWNVKNNRGLSDLLSITEFLSKTYRKFIGKSVNVFHNNTFCIKISTGCLNACSFCAVKLSRGQLKSKPVGEVIDEFREGLKQNYNEFALIGTDLGSYGRDLGTTLTDLLKELVKYEGDYKIRLRNVQPRYLIEMQPSFLEILSGNKISYISSALESGNNRILKKMNRGYTADDYKNAIISLKKHSSRLHIRTQVVVGFPGETEEEFTDTVNVLNELDFDFVEVFIFQPRPGTKAFSMKNQVPYQVAKKREQIIYEKLLLNEFKKGLRSYSYNSKGVN